MRIDGRTVRLTLDKSAKTVVLKVGEEIVVMSIGEWSKLIANPDVSDLVIAGSA